MKSEESKRSGKRPAPFSLRLNKSERAQLERDAAGEALATYIKTQIFAGNRKRRPAANTVDRKAIAQVLAMLGKSRLSQNLNQIAKLAHQGALPVDEILEQDLKEACQHIAAMRRTLMGALNMKERKT